jgi:myo-inositol-1-phosphate synthase
MALKQGVEIKPATGKLGVLTPGMGAVATTYFAGNLSIRKGLTPPVGSLCELGTIRLGKRTDNNTPKIRDYVPLAQMSDLVFGGWDPIPDNAYEAAVRAGVLEAKHLEPIREELSAIKPMPAVFDQQWVKRLDGPNKKTGTSKMHLAEQVMEDIKSFQAKHGCDRMVLIWCGSTEVYRKPSDVHSSLAKFEAGLRASDDNIAPSQIYAYAALKLGIPYANGAPNLAVDTEALMELARENHVPIAGKDFKTGQTLMKTILAPGFKARMLGLQGWYSTNILGNRDGEVLDDPESFKSKEVTKLGVLDTSSSRRSTRRCTGTSRTSSASTTTRRAATTRRAGTTSTSSGGWATRCRSRSTSCAATRSSRRRSSSTSPVHGPRQRAGLHGIQEWLSFYWKSPMIPRPVPLMKLYPEHDLFIQLMKLKNTLRWPARPPLGT